MDYYNKNRLQLFFRRGMVLKNMGEKVLKYNDNGDIVRQLKAALVLQGHTITSLAKLLNVAQPSLSRTLNETDFSFTFINKCADLIDCDLYIEIRPRQHTNNN